MRKPRDFDSELKALADKAKQLKERRVRDLGALVTATGADTLDAETLAGALLVSVRPTTVARSPLSDEGRFLKGVLSGLQKEVL